MSTLQTISLNTPVRIVSVSGDCETAQRVRELGILPGSVCSVVRRAPFGGPMEVALQRRTIGMRLTSDLQILVELLVVEPPTIPSVFALSARAHATIADDSVAA